MGSCGLAYGSFTAEASGLSDWVGAQAYLLAESYEFTCKAGVAFGVVDEAGSVSLTAQGQAIASATVTLTLDGTTAKWVSPMLLGVEKVSLGPADFVTGPAGMGGSN